MRDYRSKRCRMGVIYSRMHLTWAQVTENDSEDHQPTNHWRTIIFVRNLDLTPKLSTVIIGPEFRMRIPRIASELNTSLHPHSLPEVNWVVLVSQIAGGTSYLLFIHNGFKASAFIRVVTLFCTVSAVTGSNCTSRYRLDQDLFRASVWKGQ